jgi:hypothetical protein
MSKMRSWVFATETRPDRVVFGSSIAYALEQEKPKYRVGRMPPDASHGGRPSTTPCPAGGGGVTQMTSDKIHDHTPNRSRSGGRQRIAFSELPKVLTRPRQAAFLRVTPQPQPHCVPVWMTRLERLERFGPPTPLLFAEAVSLATEREEASSLSRGAFFLRLLLTSHPWPPSTP